MMSVSVTHEELIQMTLTLPGTSAVWLTYVKWGRGLHTYWIPKPFRQQAEQAQDMHSHSLVLTVFICIQTSPYYST